jgi:hypothetical protein
VTTRVRLPSLSKMVAARMLVRPRWELTPPGRVLFSHDLTNFLMFAMFGLPSRLQFHDIGNIWQPGMSSWIWYLVVRSRLLI